MNISDCLLSSIDFSTSPTENIWCFHYIPHQQPSRISPLPLYSLKRPLSCKFSAISSLNIPRDTHLILTSSVQLTKCRLENKWQTPKQINYVSTKLLARVQRAGAGNKSWAHTAIWPAWERTSFGGANSHRYLWLGHNREHVVKCCRISLIYMFLWLLIVYDD